MALSPGSLWTVNYDGTVTRISTSPESSSSRHLRTEADPNSPRFWRLLMGSPEAAIVGAAWANK